MEEEFLEKFPFIIEQINEDLNFEIERVKKIIKEIEKIQSLIDSHHVKANISLLLEFLENLEELTKFLGKEKEKIEEIKNLINKIKQEDKLLFELFNCYYYLDKSFLIISIKKECVIDLINDYIQFLESSKERISILINNLLEDLSEIEARISIKAEKEKEIKKKFELLKKYLKKVEEVILREIDHIGVIKKKINDFQNNLRPLRVNEIILSKRAIESIREIFKKSVGNLKVLINKLEDLALQSTESSQIEVFREIDNITLAKYPRGHTSLRFIINYNLLEKNILFIMDIVKHDSNYKKWHEDEIPKDSIEEGVKLSKFKLAFSLKEKDCLKIIADFILNHKY